MFVLRLNRVAGIGIFFFFFFDVYYSQIEVAFNEKSNKEIIEL